MGYDLPVTAGVESLIDLIDDNTALVMVQYPDFYGRLVDYEALGEACPCSERFAGCGGESFGFGDFPTPLQNLELILCVEKDNHWEFRSPMVDLIWEFWQPKINMYAH